MKIQDLTPAGRDRLQRVIAQEDEDWERSRYWWDGDDPAYAQARASNAAGDMRRWNASWTAFKTALERGEGFEDAFVAWVRRRTPDHAGVTNYLEARQQGNVAHNRLHEVYDQARRDVEISEAERV